LSEHKYYLERDPCTSNDAYSTRSYIKDGYAAGYRFLQTHHKEWKEVAEWLFYLQDLDRGKPKLPKDNLIILDITYVLDYDDLFTSMDVPHRWDVTGFIKMLEDALATHLDIDDRYNFEVRARKVAGRMNCIFVNVDTSLTKKEIYDYKKYL